MHLLVHVCGVRRIQLPSDACNVTVGGVQRRVVTSLVKVPKEVRPRRFPRSVRARVPHSATRTLCRAMCTSKHTMNNLACRLQPAARGLRQRRAAYPLQQNVRETCTRGRGVLHLGSLCCAAIRARNRECGLLPVPVRVSQSVGLSGNGQVLEAA